MKRAHSTDLSSKRQEWLPLLGLALSLFIFYPELFFAKAASLMGDHIEQHYPWALLLADSLRQFQIPFWTPLIHSGFPIAAESQIGIFYLPNLILYFLFPFHVAYSYMNLVHFYLAGASTYLYARLIKLERLPAFTAAFIFLFGAAYGGAYYNITSLKTICWLPLGLYLFEKYYQEGHKKYLVGLSFSMAMSIVAGYMQVAALTWLIFAVYVFLRLIFFPHEKDAAQTPLSHAFALILTAAGASLIAAPQIYLTFELAIQSNRTGLEEGYAYVGSLSPFALSTLIDPVAQRIFRGSSLYGGLFSLFLVLISFCSREVRGDKFFRLWSVLAVFCLFMALGRWSPLYVAFVKLTHFYSFRIPAKFSVFVCLALAFLSGMGLQGAMKAMKNDVHAVRPVLLAAKGYLGVVVIFLLAGSGVYFFATAGKEWALLIGKSYIQQFIYGHPGHPHSLETYLERLSGFPDSVLTLFALHEWVNGWTLGMILGSLGGAVFLLKSRRLSRRWMISGLIFLAIDLYGYAWFDIKRDFARYDDVLRPSAVVEALKMEKARGEMGRLYGRRNPGEDLALVPSINMLYGLEDIGAYSPFVTRRYHETVGRFGNVNDSNFAYPLDPQFFNEHAPLLNALDVSHILSSQVIDHPAWTLLIEDQKTPAYLYKNSASRSRAHFVQAYRSFSSWETLREVFLTPHFDPKKELLLEETELKKLPVDFVKDLQPENESAGVELINRSDAGETWVVRHSHAGFLVVMNTAYPGWRANANGADLPLIQAYGLFQAVWLKEGGQDRVHFSYAPFRD